GRRRNPDRLSGRTAGRRGRAAEWGSATPSVHVDRLAAHLEMVGRHEVEGLAEDDYLAIRLHDELAVTAFDDELFPDGYLLVFADAFQRCRPHIRHLGHADLFD